MTVKLEVGKQYRMRNGEKCLVVDKTHSDSYSFVCYSYLRKITMSYCEDGKYCLDHESPEDIISEWEEPRVRYVNLYERPITGHIYLTGCCYKTRKAADEKSIEEENDGAVKRIACVKFTEGTFDE